MSLPKTERDVLMALQESFDLNPNASRAWSLDGEPPDDVGAFLELFRGLDERGLALFHQPERGPLEGSITDAGRRLVADQGWNLPDVQPSRIRVQVQGNTKVKTTLLELDVRGRLVNHWQHLVEATLDGENADYDSTRLFQNRGRPMVVLRFEPGCPDGDVEATAMDLGSKILDVLERARRVQSAAVLQDLDTTERALRNAQSQLRAFLENAKQGTELTAKGAGLLKTLHDLASILGVG